MCYCLIPPFLCPNSCAWQKVLPTSPRHFVPYTPAIMICSLDTSLFYASVFYTYSSLTWNRLFPNPFKPPKHLKSLLFLPNWADCSFLGVPVIIAPFTVNGIYVITCFFPLLDFDLENRAMLYTVPGQCEVFTKWVIVEGNWCLRKYATWVRW